MTQVLLRRSAGRSPDAISFRNLLAAAIRNVGLLLVAAVLFALAFPNPVFRFGWAPASILSLIPIGVAVNRMRGWATPLHGLLFGFAAYALYNFWLAQFHPLAIFIVPTIYAVYFLLVMPALYLADRGLGRWAWLGQAAVWLAYEYLRTTGFLGYSYGILGYAYAFRPYWIQTASFGGVWIVSAMVVVPGFYAAYVLRQAQPWSAGADWARVLAATLRKRPTGAILTVLMWGFAAVWGVLSPVDYSQARTWRVALVQQNVDPWLGGTSAYRASLDVLLRESRTALERDDPEVVIWSETSFVPSINFHTQYRQDQERFEMVRELLGFVDEIDVPLILGNSDARLVQNAQGRPERVDYNAVLTYNRDGSLQGVYRKQHLVPFTEHFPYERQLPWLHQLLIENNTNFWGQGDEATIFELDGIRYATPICFEDTFGYLSRDFVNAGADVLINLTNDLWAKFEEAAMQHMGMAVFRTVENRRSMARSTNGGMTAIIDPNGRILDMYPSFVEGYLVGELPIYTETETAYTRHGDWLAFVFVAAGSIAVVIAIIRLVLARVGRLTKA